jgi:selenocysteine-specific elongation factor
VLADAGARLAEHGWPDVAHATVTATTGEGLAGLRGALDALIARMPPARTDGPVRLWIDRAFTIHGAGTVVTGTLTSGRIAVGDVLHLAPDGREVVVRGLQTLNEDASTVPAVARVAVNLRSVAREEARRGRALVTPGAWTVAADLDAVTDDPVQLPEHVVVHVGSAAVPARIRRLGPTGLRVRLATPLALHLGDRLLVRDPASRAVAAADVADLAPQPLRRRGDAVRLAASLTVPRTSDEELARHPICTSRELRARGLDDQPGDAVAVAGHWIAAGTWDRLRDELTERTAATGPLDGISLPAMGRDLGIATEVAAALVAAAPGLRMVDGRVIRAAEQPVAVPGLAELLARLDKEPFDPPGSTTLAALGLTPLALAHAVREQLLVRVADGLYLTPSAIERAVERLQALDQPFTVAAARTALGSTRRVVVPLLEHLDATRRTRRQSDGTRFVRTGRA